MGVPGFGAEGTPPHLPLEAAFRPAATAKHPPAAAILLASAAVGLFHIPTCPRAGWVSMLRLEWLRNAVQPPGSTPEPGGSACCYWSGYGTQYNHPARGQPLVEPGGSACCYWNGY